jgi:hypothetical protein
MKGRTALQAFIGGIYAEALPDHRMVHVYTNAVIDVRDDCADATAILWPTNGPERRRGKSS